MIPKRIIPVLLFHNQVLYKTTKFSKPKYVGDPINTIRIFNEKEIDEIIFIDIDASKYNREPDYGIIERIASECFMPLCYGGGIKTVTQARRIFSMGVEKIALNNILIENPEIVSDFSCEFGSQSIICSIDVKRDFFNKYKVYSHVKKKCYSIKPIEHINNLVKMGAGEIYLNMVDDDGMMHGYNTDFIKSISDHISVPVIACGGAGSISDCIKLFSETDVTAAAAGSMFVFHGKHKAVLISYPDRKDIVASIGE